MVQLTLENLTVGYEGKELIRELNMSVEEGNYICIVGENGAGKSTLIKTILGLKSPISGAVVKGENLKDNQIGYLPQQSIIQRDFPASVKEIVLSGFQGVIKFPYFYGKSEKKRAEEAMEKMGLKGKEKACYRELSGGQQQRVLLARALCATQKLIFLDEPVAGLDPKVTLELYDLIKKLNSEDGITVVMISHDVEAALKYADHILHVGSSWFFGTKEEYLASKQGQNFAALAGGERNA